MINTRKRQSFQGGFTLLEVLIAILVLSFGLLGLAAMQLNALQSAHFSYQSTIANLAAKDVKERLWAELLDKQEAEDDDGNSYEYVACPSGSVEDGRLVKVIAESNDEWGGKLPGLEIDVSEKGAPCGYRVDVFWLDERFGVVERDDGNLYAHYIYHVHLPGQAFNGSG